MIYLNTIFVEGDFMYDTNTLKILFRFSQIPITVYTLDWTYIERFSGTFMEPEAYETRKLEQAKEGLAGRKFFFLSYDPQVPVALCGCQGEEEYYILGPFSYGSLDTFECRNFLRKNKIRECPKCQLEDIFALISFLTREEFQEERRKDILGELLSDGSDEKEGENRELITREELRQLDAFQKNHTYMEEQLLYDHIKEGDAAYLESRDFYEAPSHPIIIEDIKKNEEYMTVISISLAARAAIEGGLSSAEGFINNDIYLKKLSKCRTVFEMERLRRESQIYFARLVAEHKKCSGVNFHVEEVKKNILSKRFEKISIQEIAEELGISKEYMQKLFKKYEGISITEYITDIKIESACNMLRYSDRKIQEIAQYLHYGSVSHFSTAFRKKMQQSPKEYRDQNRKTVF